MPLSRLARSLDESGEIAAVMIARKAMPSNITNVATTLPFGS